MVLQTLPPQPRSNDFAITFALVPGGPDPSRNGFSNSIPLTVTFSAGAMETPQELRCVDRGVSSKQPCSRAMRAPSIDHGRLRHHPSRHVMSGALMYRVTCPRCLRPEVVCYCAKLEHLDTATRVVLLQHPRERRVPVSTARMVHLSLTNSELHYGVDFAESQ